MACVECVRRLSRTCCHPTRNHCIEAPVYMDCCFTASPLVRPQALSHFRKNQLLNIQTMAVHHSPCTSPAPISAAAAAAAASTSLSSQQAVGGGEALEVEEGAQLLLGMSNIASKEINKASSSSTTVQRGTNRKRKAGLPDLVSEEIGSDMKPLWWHLIQYRKGEGSGDGGDGDEEEEEENRYHHRRQCHLRYRQLLQEWSSRHRSVSIDETCLPPPPPAAAASTHGAAFSSSPNPKSYPTECLLERLLVPSPAAVGASPSLFPKRQRVSRHLNPDGGRQRLAKQSSTRKRSPRDDSPTRPPGVVHPALPPTDVVAGIVTTSQMLLHQPQQQQHQDQQHGRSHSVATVGGGSISRHPTTAAAASPASASPPPPLRVGNGSTLPLKKRGRNGCGPPASSPSVVTTTTKAASLPAAGLASRRGSRRRSLPLASSPPPCSSSLARIRNDKSGKRTNADKGGDDDDTPRDGNVSRKVHDDDDDDDDSNVAAATPSVVLTTSRASSSAVNGGSNSGKNKFSWKAYPGKERRIIHGRTDTKKSIDSNPHTPALFFRFSNLRPHLTPKLLLPCSL